MLLSDFPQEIIEQFTEFLSLKDKISCSLVCKSWKGVFQDSLYSDLVINRQLLNNLVNPPQDYQHPCLKTRLLVRYLELRYYTQATDKEIYILQQTFPNIKHLNLGEESINPENFGVTVDWNIWRSLTEFHIGFDQQHVPDIENRLVETLLCLPLLRRLQILDSEMSQVRVSFSFDNFEAIHSHLNYLGYWELSSNLLTLSETDIERMAKVLPATKMRIMEITTENADHRWLCYFARKYPNLHTLNFTTSNNIPRINEKRSNTIAMFQQVPLPFQHLTKLKLEYCGWTGKDHLLFWDIIHFHNSPLKHVSVEIKMTHGTISPDNPCVVPKHATEACLARFSKTIESFHVRGLCGYSAPIDFAEIKDNLYNLVELSIIHPMPVAIDSLLCAAPRLRSVTLERSNITIKDELYNSSRFELQSFAVWEADLTSDVLRFLSFHCRRLNELDLKNTSVYGNFTIPGSQFIDMTYTRLEKLCLSMTSFIIQDNEKSPENLNIVLITRPVDDIPPKQEYDPNVLPNVVGGPPVKAHYDWFYAYNRSMIRDVSTSRGSRTHKFVLNYEENKRITSKKSLDVTRKKPYKSWNNNCVFGYTKIKLGYVRHVTIVSY